MKDAALEQAPETGSTPEPVAAAPNRSGTDWWAEAKGIFWLLVIVLGFHSFAAKPFYIPSESMLPGLEVGDRLVVNKFAYGWSFVSPTVPDPIAIFRGLVLREPVESWAVQMPPVRGRLFGRLPERGDVVIVTPPGTNNDYIKRVIGLPGDRLSVREGVVWLNGRAVQRGAVHTVDLPDYGATPMPAGGNACDAFDYGAGVQVRDAAGVVHCRLPVVTETLPNGRRYDTVELGASGGDNYPEITIPADRVFLMGDNRDRSADSRFSLLEKGLGGPVPYENLGGRAEFITFSLDGSASWWNPLTWPGSFRGGRAGHSLHPQRVN